MNKPPTFKGDSEERRRRKLAEFAATLGITAQRGVTFCYHVTPTDRFLTAYDCLGHAFAWFGFDHDVPVMMGDNQHGHFVQLHRADGKDCV